MSQGNNNNLTIKRMDQVQFQRNFLIFLGFVFTVVIGGYTVKSGNPLFMIGFVALPFVLMLMYRPDVAFVAAMLMDATGMPIPGVSYTTLGILAKVVLIGAALLAFLMGQSRNNRKKMAEDKPLKWFVAIVFLLMAVRGSGLRMLGSSTWGGMVYIVILLGIAFYFAIQGLTISRKQIRWILWGTAVCGLIGSLMSYRGWSENSQYGSEVGRSRLMWLIPFVLGSFPLVFSVKWKPWLAAVLWLALIAAMALTGFRSELVKLIVITGIYGFFRVRSKIKYLIMCFGLGVLAWGAVVAVAPTLPMGMQRAVSFVPGVTKSLAGGDADASVDWRLEIWKYCLEQSPEYLLIGRGSAFNVYETSGNLSRDDIRTFSPWFAYETRSYHSGPLTLLIDYGIPGLLIALWMLGIVLRRLWKNAKELQHANTLEERFALISVASFLWFWLEYFLVIGGAPDWGLMIAGTAGVIVIVNSVKKIREEEVEKTEGVGLLALGVEGDAVFVSHEATKNTER